MGGGRAYSTAPRAQLWTNPCHALGTVVILSIDEQTQKQAQDLPSNPGVPVEEVKDCPLGAAREFVGFLGSYKGARAGQSHTESSHVLHDV